MMMWGGMRLCASIKCPVLLHTLARAFLQPIHPSQWEEVIPSPTPPPSRPVPPGKTRICMVGFKMCPPAGKAHELAGMIAQQLPQTYRPSFNPIPLPSLTPRATATRLGTTGMRPAPSMHSLQKSSRTWPFRSISKVGGACNAAAAQSHDCSASQHHIAIEFATTPHHN